MAGKKLPSYVFSAALQNQSSEEKERRRQSLPHTFVPPSAVKVGGKVPPPVAPKPKTRSASSIAAPDMSSLPPVSAAPRKKTLPRQMTTGSISDGDAGGGQKMGGAFARLQRQIEAKEQNRDLYQEAYENYKIKRSLKEHGVLPTEHRTDENLRKFSVGSDAIPSVAPIVLPKPVRRPSWDPAAPSATVRRSSVETKREDFSRNRSMTGPASPTSPISTSPPLVYTPTPWKQSLDDCFAPNVNVRKGSRSDSASSGTTENTPKIGDYAVHGPTAETNKVVETNDKSEHDAEIDSMKKEYLVRKNSIQQGQKELADTIAQLENLDIETVVSPKSPPTETTTFPEFAASPEPATSEVSSGVNDAKEEVDAGNVGITDQDADEGNEPSSESVVSGDGQEEPTTSTCEPSSDVCEIEESQDTYFGADTSVSVDTNIAEEDSSQPQTSVVTEDVEPTDTTDTAVGDSAKGEITVVGTEDVSVDAPTIVSSTSEGGESESQQNEPPNFLEEAVIIPPQQNNPVESSAVEVESKLDDVNGGDSTSDSSVTTEPKAPIPAPRVKKETTV